MNRGSLMIEASLILPVIILIIRLNNELDMFMEFANNGNDRMHTSSNTKLPLLPAIKVEFDERREGIDYGRRIQRSKIIPDIFKD